MQLTKNFSLREITASAKARELGIDNALPKTSLMLHNAKTLAERLQQIRNALTSHNSKDTKLFVSSGYRCRTLNLLLGGVETSQHVLCLAADIYTPSMSADELFDFIYNSGIKYDQLIIEKVNGKEWVHISVCATERNEALSYNGKV